MVLYGIIYTYHLKKCPYGSPGFFGFLYRDFPVTNHHAWLVWVQIYFIKGQIKSLLWYPHFADNTRILWLKSEFIFLRFIGEAINIIKKVETREIPNLTRIQGEIKMRDYLALSSRVPRWAQTFVIAN